MRSKTTFYVDVWPINFFDPDSANYFDTCCLFLLQLACILNMVGEILGSLKPDWPQSPPFVFLILNVYVYACNEHLKEYFTFLWNVSRQRQMIKISQYCGPNRRCNLIFRLLNSAMAAGVAQQMVWESRIFFSAVCGIDLSGISGNCNSEYLIKIIPFVSGSRVEETYSVTCFPLCGRGKGRHA